MKVSTQNAKAAGFAKVQQPKGEVARGIRTFVANGGFLFAMCSATDSIDLALAADGVDIIPPEIDGDGQDPGMESKLDFTKTFAFTNFTITSGGTRDASSGYTSSFTRSVTKPAPARKAPPQASTAAPMKP